MPEIRFDALTAAFTIIATERAKRPSDFRLGGENLCLPERDERCPFCPGNESETPPEIWAKREGGKRDGPGWKVRVVPNKFPALIYRPDDAEDSESWRIPPFPEAPEATVYWQSPAVGHHEVVVESPIHRGTLGGYSAEQALEILGAVKVRCQAMYDDKDVAYVQVFKNSGKIAGASLTHPHFQMMALPFMPPIVSREGQRLRDYEAKTRRCLICDLLEREIEKDVRIVFRNERFVVLSPFASRYSYETLIAPREHLPGITEFGDAVMADLAATLVQLFGAYERMFPSLPYNMVFHGLPAEVREKRGWPCHAHIHVYPRLNAEAGLELGAGAFINPTPPELATKEFADAI